ncbi:hypothetical protein [Neobacillus mesonae]|uniref:hypothetical protein n=1 Tax=Neobacillus mesonae TaxID=1193713 RepID=UPI00203F913E|nr:hypothetical protein [Neobacillus mesonae]MCM3567844.1 hypothetical protein [Neobacillus mesonae]
MKEISAIGRVSAVYPDRMTAKVFHEDRGTVTGELSILDRGDGWLPKVGDSVWCLFLPVKSSEGCILGGM